MAGHRIRGINRASFCPFPGCLVDKYLNLYPLVPDCPTTIKDLGASNSACLDSPEFSMGDGGGGAEPQCDDWTEFLQDTFGRCQESSNSRHLAKQFLFILVYSCLFLFILVYSCLFLFILAFLAFSCLDLLNPQV